MKLNTDGASSRCDGTATSGGVIHDSSGRWLYGFAHKIGACSSLEAELWVVLEGLKIAWNLGSRRIQLEVN